MQQQIDKLIVKLSYWIRWVLILPVAIAADLIAQTVYRIIFRAIPFASIHLYTDEIVWTG